MTASEYQQLIAKKQGKKDRPVAGKSFTVKARIKEVKKFTPKIHPDGPVGDQDQSGSDDIRYRDMNPGNGPEAEIISDMVLLLRTYWHRGQMRTVDDFNRVLKENGVPITITLNQKK